MNLRRVDRAPIQNSLGRKTQLDNRLFSRPPLRFWRKKYLAKSLDNGGGEGPKGGERQLLIRRLNSGQNKLYRSFCLNYHQKVNNQNQELTVTSLSPTYGIIWHSCSCGHSELLGSFPTLTKLVAKEKLGGSFVCSDRSSLHYHAFHWHYQSNNQYIFQDVSKHIVDMFYV